MTFALRTYEVLIYYYLDTFLYNRHVYIQSTSLFMIYSCKIKSIKWF